MFPQIDRELFKQGFFNEVKSFPPLIAGAVTAVSINLIGHSIFKPKKNSVGSIGIKLGAFAGGAAAAIYTNRLLPLRVFTGGETWQLARAVIPVFLIIQIIVAALGLKVPTIPAVGGALMGMAGQFVPRSVGVIGAAFGALI